MITISRVYLILIFLLISGCGKSTESHMTSPNAVNKMTEMKLSWQTVTVKYLDFEGGFYGLVSQSGAKFLPMGLPKKYKIEGTILRVKGRPLLDVMTIQQWGDAFEIVELELIEMGADNQSR